jgi:septal ring factor EnvC (AmiA/AmiB activator)
MSSSRRTRTVSLRLVAASALLGFALAAMGTVSLSSAASPSLGQLHSQLGQQQARQQSLAASLNTLDGLISSLDSQITLVENRESAVREALSNDRVTLARVQQSLARERRLLARLRTRLARARASLSRQLVSSYESDKPDLVSVVLEARGFADLLDQIDFLRQAERQQQSTIVTTRDAKAQADRAAQQLGKLEITDRQITQAAYLQGRALAGMNALLQSKQAALQQAQAAQQAALQASRARASELHSAISRVEAQQAAARAAAAAAAAQRSAAATPSSPSSPSGSSTPPPTTALGPGGGWVIPYAIVLCESGGQNLPPNSAGASGYYQIIPGTWSLYGGTGPAAYLASKAEQDAVASRIWDGGKGASAWVCAGIVGIH